MDFSEFKDKYEKVPAEHYQHRVTENPLVSVCVQTYQHASYIKQCLDGVLMQQVDFDFEILLGEDASTDGTHEICIAYAEKYPDKIRLILHSRENNISIAGKPSGRFNFLYNLFSARGKYIALCEGDDYWTDPYKLQKQFDFLEANPECNLICHKMPSFMKSNSGWYGLKELASTGYLPHASNYFMKRFDLKKYEQAFYDFLGGEVLILYIAANEGLIYHDETPVSYYRYNESGVYNSLNQIQKLNGEIYQLEMINRHFSLPKSIYYKRKINLVLKYKSLANKNFFWTSVYRIYKFVIHAWQAVNRRLSVLS